MKFLNFFKTHKKIYYISEGGDWVIDRIGSILEKNLTNKFNNKFIIKTNPQAIRNSIVHFGSRSVYLPEPFKKVHKSNKVVFTWFHGTSEDKIYIDSLKDGSKRADFIHTSCILSKNDLIKWGAEEKKIVVIPIGIDLSLFKPLNKEEKEAKRAKLGIPEKKILIGSFQKDGNGWGEGLEPKLIKGPDIFCDTVEELYRNYPIFILLTGPARGYVKNRLKAKGIPYKHFFIEDHNKIGEYFNLLDLYLITSRAEGGPKAITESMASGVPLVSTKVGMTPEVIIHGENGLLTDVEDTKSIVTSAGRIIEDESLQKKFIKNGLKTVKKYDWQLITQAYFDEIYSKLL